MSGKEYKNTEIWNKEKSNSLREFVILHSQKQSKERRIKNELLAIKFQIEDYIESEEVKEKKKILDFVKMYINVLNITQKRLAALFEMRDSNLYKYLNGERKLNSELAIKLGSFSHLNPEYWLRIEVKNELFEINEERKINKKKYSKYDYKNLLEDISE